MTDHVPEKEDHLPLWSQRHTDEPELRVQLPEIGDWPLLLYQAQEELRKRLRNGTTCPCCGRHAQVYRRKLTSAMVRDLIDLHRYHNRHPKQEWVHMGRDLAPFRASGITGGDYAKLEWWGLVESKPERKDDGNPSSGYFRITEKGRAFVLGAQYAPSHCFEFQGRPLGFTADFVNAKKALGAKFNYSELMQA